MGIGFGFRRRPRFTGRRPLLEVLEDRALLAGDTLLITEFMAANDRTLADGDGNYPDWIEIHNPTSGSVDLDGWYLTDDPDRLDRWPLPAVTLDAGEYLLVFASGQPVDDYVDRAGNLHANFALQSRRRKCAAGRCGHRPSSTALSITHRRRRTSPTACCRTW